MFLLQRNTLPSYQYVFECSRRCPGDCPIPRRPLGLSWSVIGFLTLVFNSIAISFWIWKRYQFFFHAEYITGLERSCYESFPKKDGWSCLALRKAPFPGASQQTEPILDSSISRLDHKYLQEVDLQVRWSHHCLLILRRVPGFNTFIITIYHLEAAPSYCQFIVDTHDEQ